MQSLLATWHSMTLRRRAITVAATAAMFAAVLLLAQVASRPSMSLLYSGLDTSRAGEVLAALDQRGSAYEVRGSAIYVDSARRDELRMALAAEGLPANDGVGYELLDSLSGFGTTAQMFDAAYWRAKEGELARTIETAANVRHARVHIANPGPVGLRPAAKPTASVTLTANAGGLTAAQAKALRYLVASAVAGLAPSDVAIIDSQAGLIASGESADAADGGDKAEALKRNVERLLEARVGYGNAIVEVSVETSDSHEAITERRFDPQSRVAISTDSEQTSSTANNSAGGAVTVASNLPQGASGAQTGSQSNNNETRERVNYEVSETKREVIRQPGAISRLTVAVLLNAVQIVGADGQPTSEARGDEELSALRELVASAVGFNEQRGDQLTLRSMPFEKVPTEGSPAMSSFLPPLNLDIMTLIQLAVLALVSLVIGLFVVRPLLMLPAPAVATLALPTTQSPLTGEIQATGIQPLSLPIRREEGRDLVHDPESDPVARLRRMIDSRRSETVEILRGWMEDPRREDA